MDKERNDVTGFSYNKKALQEADCVSGGLILSPTPRHVVFFSLSLLCCFICAPHEQ